MHHRTDRIFKILVAIVTALSLGAPVITGSAHHYHYRHFRISRRYHHKVHRHGRRGTLRLRRRRHAKRNRRLSRLRLKKNLREIYLRTIWDVNRDRHHYKIRRLRADRQLSRIGTVRSRQLEHYFSHNTPRHADEIQHLLQRSHVDYNYYGENIAGSPMGTISTLAVGPYANPNDADSQKLTYRAHNGYQLADNINNASMDHDAGDQDGHRANDLDRDFNRIGVGVSYNRYDQNYYIAVEFIG